MNKNIAEIERIFHPKTVAIIGASNRPGSFGRTFVEGLQKMGFEGIFPVNPKDSYILGLKSYSSILDIPQDIDIAMVLIPTLQCPEQSKNVRTKK